MTAAVVLGCMASVAFAAPAAPGNRAYELVSPSLKNGGDVMGDSARTRAAADGNAASFTSLVGFGDVIGTSVGTEYMSVRNGAPGTSGWSSHAITPQQPAMTFGGALNGLDPAYEADFSADLSHGVFRSWLPITDAPNVAEVSNLYLRDDLKTPGRGSYELMTDAPAPLAPTVLRGWVAGASGDFSHVIFESNQPLTPDAPDHSGDAPEVSNLFEFVNGAARLVGRVPVSGASCDDANGPACAPAPRSNAGLGASSRFYTQRTISTDSSRIFFTDPSTGKIYVRTDGSVTAQLNASEKTSPEAPQAASFWTASTDGDRAFFTTTEGLVNGDDDGGPDLYAYDAARPAGNRLTLVSVDAEPLDGGAVLSVVGASEDGTYAYFVAGDQLVAGEPVVSGQGLYVWHAGVVSYLGQFVNPFDSFANGPQTTWNFDLSTSTARVTPDGRHLLFMSQSDVGFRGRGGFAGYDQNGACPDDGGGCREFYTYSADTGSLTCVSCSPTSATARSDASIQARTGNGGANTTSHLSNAISDDGRYVFFSTRDALVTTDTNGRYDAYVYDAVVGRAFLLSLGTGAGDSYFMDASASGDDVFFMTRDQLVGWDVDNNYDLYDARVNGGFPEPIAPPAGCSGDSCQGPPTAAPERSGAGSATLKANGNQRSVLTSRKHVRCKRGTKLKKVRGKRRCVRKSRKAGKQMRAAAQRRGK